MQCGTTTVKSTSVQFCFHPLVLSRPYLYLTKRADIELLYSCDEVVIINKLFQALYNFVIPLVKTVLLPFIKATPNQLRAWVCCNDFVLSAVFSTPGDFGLASSANFGPCP